MDFAVGVQRGFGIVCIFHKYLNVLYSYVTFIILVRGMIMAEQVANVKYTNDDIRVASAVLGALLGGAVTGTLGGLLFKVDDVVLPPFVITCIVIGIMAGFAMGYVAARVATSCREDGKEDTIENDRILTYFGYGRPTAE
jgi:predicted lipid-binding transport protein (Tim44 family)